MKTFAPFFQVLGISITLCTQADFADEGISTQEADSLIKDDIASTQVLQEICPNFVGANKNLKPIPKRLLQCIWVVIPINQSPSLRCKMIQNIKPC